MYINKIYDQLKVEGVSLKVVSGETVQSAWFDTRNYDTALLVASVSGSITNAVITVEHDDYSDGVSGSLFTTVKESGALTGTSEYFVDVNAAKRYVRFTTDVTGSGALAEEVIWGGLRNQPNA